MKPIYPILFLLALTACSRKDSIPTIQNSNPDTLIPKSVINDFIAQKLGEEDHFEWAMANDSLLWSALVQSDSVLSIGYNSGDREKVLQVVKSHEAALIFPFKEGKLPFVNLKVSNFATIKALRTFVRYADPIGYGAYSGENARPTSSLLNFGCGSNTAETGLVAGTDYTDIAPAAKQSWNYSYHHIPEAWQSSTGENIKVMIIDTGISDDQENLGTAFNQGSSSGRSITRAVTYSGGTTNDECGHGTSMAGALAGPRGTDGNTAGIAYNCNLLMVHAAENVVILSSKSVNGVTDAYVMGGDDPDVKIISMSMGTIFNLGQIKDAIAYADSKQKLMFCAAGTSFSFFASFVGVIFPANQPQVHAVTGVKDNLTTRCDDCHEGSKVDFTIVMEKASTGLHPLSLAMSGNVPSTVGGSSVATASCSGIAALIWSKYPSYPRDSILSKMRRAASYPVTRNSTFGWGVVDVATALAL
ncbi:S8 family peptidase [Chitinophaga sancti]|uniref:S8/S53 family peptidase n=1 Tax=Chitinophaga sancti TaxID=1004 RepID=A0A1K1SBF6_9BACT|nr:S8/S53 family peptidase [Chitinophaga sancti]WQD63553.1 S8/S53 family peptidase [Chitinophaga sancti]WQG90821.1 S8/S53 family peptidase [Chitinophaga sancti]SFW81696.1 Subtilase family protein [Chitinophaga sancti]